NRGVAALTTLSLDALLDERAREIYWEGWRRQDLIRFGKFLEPKQEKPATSDPRVLVYPIPSQQIAVNTNLTQNPGYYISLPKAGLPNSESPFYFVYYPIIC